MLRGLKRSLSYWLFLLVLREVGFSKRGWYDIWVCGFRVFCNFVEINVLWCEIGDRLLNMYVCDW